MRLVASLLLFWIAIAAAWAGTPSSMLMLSQQAPPSWVLPGAALDFNFANGAYWNSGASTVLTVTRATTETCTSVGGTLSYAASGVPCITDAGLQVWPAATNLILQSQFAATWTATRSTLTANAVVSPDTSTNAATLIEDNTATSTHLATQTLTKAASALPYTFSVYAKSSTRTRIDLQLDDAAGNGAVMVCDLSGQQVGVAAAGVGSAFTSLSSSAVTVGAWTRCQINATTNTATSLVATIFLDSGSGTAAISNSYTGNATSGAPVFGAQVEQNGFGAASPYIPTTTGSATRNLDNISRTISVGPVYGAFGQGTPQTPAANTGNQTVLSIDDGTTTNRMSPFRTAVTSASSVIITSGGSTMYSASGSNWGINTSTKIATSAIAGTQRAAFNGTAYGNGSGASMPVSPTAIHFGERGDAGANTQWCGNIARIAVFNSFLDGLINLTK